MTKEKIEQLIENILEDYRTGRIHLKKILEKHLKSLQEPIEERKVEQYQCLSYVEGGVVKGCTCGKCF